MNIYVVRRAFKIGREIYRVGTVITDPSAIKNFKLRLSDGNFFEVTEQNLERIAAYTKARANVDPTVEILELLNPSSCEEIAKEVTSVESTDVVKTNKGKINAGVSVAKSAVVRVK